MPFSVGGVGPRCFDSDETHTQLSPSVHFLSKNGQSSSRCSASRQLLLITLIAVCLNLPPLTPLALDCLTVPVQVVAVLSFPPFNQDAASSYSFNCLFPRVRHPDYFGSSYRPTNEVVSPQYLARGLVAQHLEIPSWNHWSLPIVLHSLSSAEVCPIDRPQLPFHSQLARLDEHPCNHQKPDASRPVFERYVACVSWSLTVSSSR